MRTCDKNIKNVNLEIPWLILSELKNYKMYYLFIAYMLQTKLITIQNVFYV